MEQDKLSLSTPINDLEKQLKEAQDGDSLQKVVDLFNLNIKKKDIIRAGQLSELQDKISQQMADRVNNHAGEFSNKDLLDYFKVIGETLNKSDTLITPENMPAIQVNQQNVHINVGDTELSRDSKEKVMSKVQEILSRLNTTNIIDVQPTEIKDSEENVDDTGTSE